MVTGTAQLDGDTPNADVTVTLSGAAAFTSKTTYVCTVGDETNAGSTAFISKTDGSHFTLFGINGSTDFVSFVCVGH